MKMQDIIWEVGLGWGGGPWNQNNQEMALASLAAITYFNMLRYALVFTVAKHTFPDFRDFLK